MAWYNDVWNAVAGPAGKKIGGIADESESAKRQREMLEAQGFKSSEFADTGQAAFGALGAEGAALRDALRRRAAGEDSLSREQLRQGTQSLISAQQSMARSAAPRDATGAAFLAMRNAARLGSGMAGQAAIAGIEERAAAQKALAEAIERARQQELQAAIEGRRGAIAGYGGFAPERSDLEKWGPAIQAGIQAGVKAASDERLKEDVAELDDEDARKVLDGLKGYAFKYKDAKFGRGRQVGVMAQDLERAGLGHAVTDEREGKMVHGAKLATSVAALAASLHRRVAKLEGRGKE